MKRQPVGERLQLGEGQRIEVVIDLAGSVLELPHLRGVLRRLGDLELVEQTATQGVQ
jgi:hypothetical protein